MNPAFTSRVLGSQAYNHIYLYVGVIPRPFMQSLDFISGGTSILSPEPQSQVYILNILSIHPTLVLPIRPSEDGVNCSLSPCFQHRFFRTFSLEDICKSQEALKSSALNLFSHLIPKSSMFGDNFFYERKP